MSHTATAPATVATTAPATVTADKLLTKKQVAILDNLNSLDMSGLTLVAVAGRGTASKLSAGVVADKLMAEALESFARSGCTNVRPFAVLVNSLTGQFTDGKSLKPAPTRKADFLTYDSQVYAWAIGSENEKTQAVRLGVYEKVSEVVQAVRVAADAAHAARLAAVAAADAARLAAEAPATAPATVAADADLTPDTLAMVDKLEAAVLAEAVATADADATKKTRKGRTTATA